MFNNETHNRMHRRKKLFLVPVFILLFFGLSAAVQYLWNYVLPSALHASPITYWQAGALLVLAKILFGSFHFGRRHGGPGFGGGPSKEMREKWMNMTVEERALFKQKFKD